jgi:hypothetical protein
MSKGMCRCRNPPFFDQKQLINLKTKAMLSGVWFKVLPKIDRLNFDLTTRTVYNFPSTRLAKSMRSLSMKLINALKESFPICLNETGLSYPKKVNFTVLRLRNFLVRSLGLCSYLVSCLSRVHIYKMKTKSIPINGCPIVYGNC